MKFAFQRYGKPWLAVSVMLLIYSCSHVVMFCIAIHSGWGALARDYKRSSRNAQVGTRFPGKLVLNGISFGVSTAGVYAGDNTVIIRANHSRFFMTSLHFQDLEIPIAKISGDPTAEGAWIACADDAKVFIILKPAFGHAMEDTE